MAIREIVMFHSELRRLADAGSAEHQWKLSVAYREAKRSGRAGRYFRRAFEQGYPDALLYQLEQWTTQVGEYANFAAAQKLLERYCELDCLDAWRWRLGIVAGSMTGDQELASTRLQLQNNNPAAMRYVALRCAVAGYDEQARLFLQEACDAGDDWSGRILDDETIPGLPVLPGTSSGNGPPGEGWHRAFIESSTPEKVELAAAPRVYICHNWLPVVGCRMLAVAAEPELRPSLAYDPQTGRQIESPLRTSYSMIFMPWLMDPSVAFIQRRLAAFCGMRPFQCEVLGLLRYQPGQAYELHYDAFAEDQAKADVLLQDGGQRIRTALVYLNESYVGGETRMENLDIDVKGRTGDLLVFDNVDEQGLRHPDSLHTGRPVVSGTKWLLSQWYREHETAFTKQINWREAQTVR
jgi:hypothetical protein